MHLKIELGFINALAELWEEEEVVYITILKT